MLEKYFSNKYLDGNILVGDDFKQEEIDLWYKEEEEAYSKLASDGSKKNYLYENINNFYGLKSVLHNFSPNEPVNILCFGAAYGGEVIAIKKILDDRSISYSITVVDSSDIMLDDIKKRLSVNILKASSDGKIDLKPNSFDLITCFGILHHIANVSFVLSQFYKILKNGGGLFLREPISSMGNWNKVRIGTTISERGIAKKYLVKQLNILGFNVLSCQYTFVSPLLKIFNRFNLDITSKIVIYSDFILSKILSWNIYYYRDTKFKKIAPGSVYILCKKVK